MSQPATLEQQLVIFALGAEEYALGIQHVQEIIRYTEPRAVAAPDPAVRGVISLRGKIVPVIDLAVRLGLVVEPGPDRKIVIVETGETTAGVVVDAVEEVLTVDASVLDELPGGGSDVIEGIAKLDDRLVVLLTAERLLGGLAPAAA